MCHVQFKQLKFKTTAPISPPAATPLRHHHRLYVSDLEIFVMQSFQASLKSHVHCLIKSNSLVSSV